MSRLTLAGLLLAGAAVAAEQGHGGGGHAQPSMTWKLVNFAILAGALGWAIGKYAGPFFRGRTEAIRASIDQARQVREEAEARAAAIEQKLAHLGAEIEAMRASAAQEMTLEGARLSEETRRLLSRIEQQAQQEIASLTKHAENELRAHAAGLAVALAEQKIRIRVNPATEGALLDRFVSDLRRGGASLN